MFVRLSLSARDALLYRVNLRLHRLPRRCVTSSPWRLPVTRDPSVSLRCADISDARSDDNNGDTLPKPSLTIQKVKVGAEYRLHKTRPVPLSTQVLTAVKSAGVD